jgi:hypothetical protein
LKKCHATKRMYLAWSEHIKSLQEQSMVVHVGGRKCIFRRPNVSLHIKFLFGCFLNLIFRVEILRFFYKLLIIWFYHFFKSLFKHGGWCRWRENDIFNLVRTTYFVLTNFDPIKQNITQVFSFASNLCHI